MGRRGDQLLLQGEIQRRSEGVVHTQPVSIPARKERAGRGHRTDHHAGQQLVQKQTAAGQSRRGQGEVRSTGTAPDTRAFKEKMCSSFLDTQEEIIDVWKTYYLYLQIRP